MNWLSLLTVISALVIITRVICLSSRIAHASWTGHKLQFTALSAGHAFLLGGAGAALIYPNWAMPLLIVGIAIVILSDRRKPDAKN